MATRILIGLVYCLLCYIGLVWGQSYDSYKYGGKPFIRNFTAKEYEGYTQNWVICQDKRGLMYIANNYGLLAYDGSHFSATIIEANKANVIRGLACDSITGRIYVGLLDNFGYMNVSPTGSLEFVSLLDKVDTADRKFGDILKIYTTASGIYFFSYKAIFRYQNGNIRSFKVANQTLSSLHYIHGRIFFQGYAANVNSLFEIVGDSIIPIQSNVHLKDNWIVSALADTNNSAFLFSRKGILKINLAQHDSNAIRLLRTPIDSFIIQNQIMHAIRLSDGRIALATRLGGIIITDVKLNPLEVINKSKGLIDNNIKFLYEDTQRGLWAATNNGIARIEISSPIRYWDESFGLDGVVQAVRHFNGYLYIGTSQATYYWNKDKFVAIKEIPHICEDIREIPSPDGRGSQLLAATGSGIYRLEGTKAIPILTQGLWQNIAFSDVYPDRVLVGGTQGLIVLVWKKGRWEVSGLVSRIRYPVYSIATDTTGNIFISSVGNGLARIKFAQSGSHDSITYLQPTDYQLIIDEDITDSAEANGLILAMQTHKTPFFTSYIKMYRYNIEKRKIEIDTAFCNALRTKEDSLGISYAYGNRRGDIWYAGAAGYSGKERQNSFGLAQALGNGSYRNIVKPFLRLPDEVIFSVWQEHDSLVWITSPNSLFVYRFQPYQPHLQPFRVHLNRVVLNDTLVAFEGYFVNKNNSVVAEQLMGSLPQFPYRHNSVSFRYSALSFDGEKNANQYRHWLVGYETQWSGWSVNTHKEYTNLPEGNYTLKVQAKNVHGQLSKVMEYKFHILPPWYRTLWAYGLYIVSLGIGIYGIVRWRLKALENKVKQLDAVVQLRTQELRAANEELTTSLEQISTQKKEIEAKNEELNQAYEEIHITLEQVNEQKQIIEQKNLDIIESIEYAQRIQAAVLPDPEMMLQFLPEYLLYFRPKDIVSGDFYWMEHELMKDAGSAKTIFAVADCTGHGVPGAFMSMLGNSLLNQIVDDLQILEADQILFQLDRAVKRALKQFDTASQQKDGMDIAICIWEPATRRLEFAAANRPLWLFKPENGHQPAKEYIFEEIKGDKFPIGGMQHQNKHFTKHIIDIAAGTRIYLFSDGITDQFGGPHKRKLTSKRLKTILAEIQHLNISEQALEITTILEDWKKYNQQVDDMTLLGVNL